MEPAPETMGESHTIAKLPVPAHPLDLAGAHLK